VKWFSFRELFQNYKIWIISVLWNNFTLVPTFLFNDNFVIFHIPGKSEFALLLHFSPSRPDVLPSWLKNICLCQFSMPTSMTASLFVSSVHPVMVMFWLQWRPSEEFELGLPAWLFVGWGAAVAAAWSHAASKVYRISNTSAPDARLLLARTVQDPSRKTEKKIVKKIDFLKFDTITIKWFSAVICVLLYLSCLLCRSMEFTFKSI
jgi:hypothetical protein